jgi:very-short-patch-repair endonuclease
MADSFVTVPVTCTRCGISFQKKKGEYNRRVRLGRPMFCGTKCAGATINAAKKSLEIARNCECCGAAFVTTTHHKKVNVRFCSRGCASRGSMSDSRRAAQAAGGHQTKANLLSPEETLRLREAWKYTAVEAKLKEDKRDYQFEYRIGDFIFDLALLDSKTLVEFDGPNHQYQRDHDIDVKKDAVAKAAGFAVIRRPTGVLVVIDPTSLSDL